VGCSDQAKTVPLHPVSGEVVYNNKPAAGVIVYLLPTSAPLPAGVPQNPHGVTGADGRFKISTLGTDDGAPEGSYQVVLLWRPESAESEEEVTTDKLFGWYDAKHSKLTVEVHPGGTSIPAFKLPAVNGPPPVSQGVPGRN
jgi:hypothetical protein